MLFICALYIYNRRNTNEYFQIQVDAQFQAKLTKKILFVVWSNKYLFKQACFTK